MRKTVSLRKIGGLLISLLIVSFSIGNSSYGSDGSNQLPGEEKEAFFSSEQHGITLYKHHLDQGGYCLLLNDIALTDPEMEELMNLDSNELQKKVLKRANLLIRKEPGMQKMNTNNVTVHIYKHTRNARSYSGDLPYTLDITYAAGAQTIQMSSKIHVVEEELASVIPNPPPGSQVTPGQSGQTGQSDDDIRIQGGGEVIEEEEPQKAGSTQRGSGNKARQDTGDENSPDVAAEEEQLLEQSEKEPQNNEGPDEAKDPVQQSGKKTNRGILAYSYVATFSFSGILAVIFGVSLFWDIKTILWYRKKRKERKEKRKCRSLT